MCQDEEGVEIFCYCYGIVLWILITSYIFDMIPVSAILLFHHFNFKDRPNEDVVTETTIHADTSFEAEYDR